MVQIQNESKQIALVTAGRVADNHWTRLKGLIGTKQLTEGEGLLIKPCKSVHCMFMSIPIDVLYVDKHDRVLGFDENLRPWRIGRIFGASRYVVELPAGTVARTGTAVGDQLAVIA